MRSDSELQAAVVERMRLDGRLAPSDIGVAARDGVVTLNGEVDSLTKRVAAARAAEAVPGVIAVANDIDVRIPGDQRRSDVDIAHDLVEALMWDTDVPDKTIKARVQDQWVWLVGECEWAYQRAAAEHATEHIAGVKGIVNSVRVTRGSPPRRAAPFR